MIVINKVLCGDAGDNIKSIVRYKKGNRTYRFAESDYKKFIEATGISDINTFKTDFDDIATSISHNPKFEQYGITAENVREMLDYNLKLVWLNESVLPGTVTTAMVQFEYNKFDVSTLKHNSKILAGSSNNIEDIFNSI
jgi:hypothetical protein